jgi:hypothetical protein
MEINWISCIQIDFNNNKHFDYFFLILLLV